ncbi:MAG: DUF4142 domain-containing protein [Candidatus Eremiobacteraeota bacterium]|nr:DUF4142 domain-containing protein [Candidatus Eremiobacteraeota bacterium]
MKNTAKLALCAFTLWGATAFTFAQQPSTSANPPLPAGGAPADVGTPSASPNPGGLNLPQGTPSMTPQPAVPNATSLNPGGDIVRGVDGNPGLPSAKASARDRNFMVQAAQGGMAEVQMAQLALKKTNNPKVRDFAQMMVKDHSELNSKLTPMATQLGVSLPTRMTAADAGALSRLSRQSGSTFDRNYMAVQKSAHTKALALFQEAGAQADNLTLRNFFAQNAETIAMHLEMLK